MTQPVPRFDVVTIFPEMVTTALGFGVVGRALESGSAQVQTWDPRAYTTDRHRTVDDRPYGGGPGMVMKFEPLAAAVRAAKAARADAGPVVYLSPQGAKFDDRRARELATGGAVIVCGRYEGVDERFVDACVDEELSVGDYVLSGGEPAAIVVLDAAIRLIPGVLGDENSAAEDSFAAGILDHPHYTRPEEIEGRRVPEVLISGDHSAINQWRLAEAQRRTRTRRTDLLADDSARDGAEP